MTIEVREAVAFSCAHVTPEETHALLEKNALFHPHPTPITRCVESMGELVASVPLGLDGRIRLEEAVPAPTRVLATSLDGANVLLTEPNGAGAKRGRPAQRADVGPLAAISQRVFHSSDYNTPNYKIALPEPLRLIQLYNSTGYHIDASTSDGFGPGVGDQTGAPHDSDYNPQSSGV